MRHDIQIPIPILIFEDDNPTRQILWPFVDGQNWEITTDIKDKQQAVIEFILLEGCDGDEIVIRVRNI
jgi:hypothetical protein